MQNVDENNFTELFIFSVMNGNKEKKHTHMNTKINAKGAHTQIVFMVYLFVFLSKLKFKMIIECVSYK